MLHTHQKTGGVCRTESSRCQTPKSSDCIHLACQFLWGSEHRRYPGHSRRAAQWSHHPVPTMDSENKPGVCGYWLKRADSIRARKTQVVERFSFLFVAHNQQHGCDMHKRMA